jgi:hypothetical protein
LIKLLVVLIKLGVKRSSAFVKSDVIIFVFLSDNSVLALLIRLFTSLTNCAVRRVLPLATNVLSWLSTGGARAVEIYLKVFSRLESREGSKRPPTPESKSPSGFPELPWEPKTPSEPLLPPLEDADEGAVGEDVPSTFGSGEDDVTGVFVTVMEGKKMQSSPGHQRDLSGDLTPGLNAKRILQSIAGRELPP